MGNSACGFSILLLLVWLMACAPGAGPRQSPTDPLANATYEGIYEYPVRLEGGRYEGEPFQSGAASRPTVVLLEEPRANGDLDGDGLDEGVALLAESSGGSGIFVYLAVVDRQGEEPRSLATRLLGDRIQVTSLAVEEEQIRVVWSERGATRSTDPTRLELVLADGALIEPMPSVMRGLLIRGHEVRSFTACGSTAESWFIDATDGEVQRRYDLLATEPYQPVLFELVGTYEPAPATGFGAEYDRSLRITEVLTADRRGCND